MRNCSALGRSNVKSVSGRDDGYKKGKIEKIELIASAGCFFLYQFCILGAGQ